jgi:hypothetical protein
MCEVDWIPLATKFSLYGDVPKHGRSRLIETVEPNVHVLRLFRIAGK